MGREKREPLVVEGKRLTDEQIDRVFAEAGETIREVIASIPPLKPSNLPRMR